jgi:hypothetical protein
MLARLNRRKKKRARGKLELEQINRRQIAELLKDLGKHI